MKENAKYDFTKIKLLATDVDGVMTDAGMYYTESGDEIKKFNTRDGMGIVLLKRHFGIPTAIITREKTNMVARRAEKLNIEYCFQGIKEKLGTFTNLLDDLNLTPGDVAYVGDDINDLEVLEVAGFSFCPSDAEDEIKNIVGYICKTKGGEGVLREIANLIMRAKIKSQ